MRLRVARIWADAGRRRPRGAIISGWARLVRPRRSGTSSFCQGVEGAAERQDRLAGHLGTLV